MLQAKFSLSTILALLLFLTIPDKYASAQFVDVGGSSGITTPHDGQLTSFDMGVGAGAAWFDYDQDGDLDLYMTMRQGANLLYQNNAGTFTEVAAAAGAEDALRDGAGVVAADFDNDGCKDLYLANSNEDTLLRNNCDGTFTDVTVGSGIEASGARRGTSASVGDYDGDGLLDLYVAHHTPIAAYGVPDDKQKDQDYLFHNDGSFIFTDVSDDMLGATEREDASFIASWTDFDNDGDLDIYLIRDCGFDGSGAMDLWRNDGGTDGVTDWTFTEVASTVNGNWCQNGMGVAVGDYDRNGYMDLFYTDNGAVSSSTPSRAGTILLANSATGFTDVTDVAGVATNNFSWGANFFDYDLDGYLDLFMAAGAVNDASALIESKLWHSDGGTFTFTDVTAAQGVSDTGRGRVSIFGDYDQDGDPDLFYVNYAGDVHLWRNDNGGSNNWLILDLQGVTSNRDGIGARIELISAGGTQYYEVRSGSSLGGGDDTGAYFGLGADANVTTINITWPSGTVQTLSNVGANQRMTVVESATSGGLFTDVSAAAGVNVTHGGATDGDMPVGTGAAWLDYDNDGDVDLYMTNREGANWLFENNAGVFTDVAAAAGVQDITGTGAGVAAADFNNDGCIDLFLANTHADVLYQNNCDGTFSNITSGSGLDITEDRRGTSASWADYDNDGFVDLYLANHMPAPAATFTGDSEQDYLFRNNGGSGTFTDVSDMILGADRVGRSFIGGWTDYDNDGDIDLYTIRDCPFGTNSGPMRLYRNDGGTDGATDWTFTQVAETVGADWCQNGMGLAIGDYNRDGWMDFFFTDNGAATGDYPASPNRIGSVLLRNDNGSFTEQTDFADVDNNKFSWGANFFDFNNDMFQDLYMVAGAMDPLVALEGTLWENDGDGTFSDVSASSGGLNDSENTRTSAFADYDGDGDLDMFLVNYGQQARLFRNDNSNGNNWVAFNLEGTTSNRDGIGAKVQVTTSDAVVQHYEIRSGSSLGAGDYMTAFFGLGANSSITDVTVTWPSGVVQILGSMGINQQHDIVEPSSGSSSLSVSPLSVDFGFVDEGLSSAPSTLTMTNTGVDPIDVTSVSISGADASDFSHTFAGPVTVAGGASSSFDVTFSPVASTAPALPEGVLYRVNVGGDLVEDWEEDSELLPSSYLVPGTATIETDNPEPTQDASVPVGTPTDLFRVMRLDANKPEPYMEWDFPVTAGQELEVRLYFVEMSRCSVGNRVFDIEIEGTLVLENFDIYNEAGGACNVGIMRSFTITQLDDNLDIVFPLANGKPSALAGIEILGSGEAPNPRSAQVNIEHTGSNSTQVVDVTGQTGSPGGSGSVLSISPESLDFGQVEESTVSSPMTVTLTNDGDNPVDVTGVSLSGTHAGEFGHTFTSPVTISAGSSSTIDVTFSPLPDPTAPEMTLPEGVLYRINAGGAVLPDEWEEDSEVLPSAYLLAGSANIETDNPAPTKDASVPVETPVDLFETMRIDANQPEPYMEWDLPVTAGAEVEVRLFFVEMSRCSTSNRVFDVTIEGALVLDNFDVFNEAGGACNVGIMRSFIVTPDDNLDISFPLENGKPATVAGIEVIATNTAPPADIRTAQLIIDHTGLNPSLVAELAGEAIPYTGIGVPPTAAFTFTATDLDVEFTDGSSDNISLASWSWDFGDGNTSTDQSPSHTYAVAGTYTVELTVTDNEGLTGTVSEDVTVTDGSGGSGAFIESGGMVVIEAENYHTNIDRSNHMWVESTEHAGFSGAGAMKGDPDTGLLVKKKFADTQSPELEYDVDFTTTGSYIVWVRVFAPDTDGNTLHVGDNGTVSASKMLQATIGSWEWTSVDTKLNLSTLNIGSAGANKIHVWMRQDGLLLDKIVLTNDPAFVPTGEGPAESPRAAAASVASGKSPENGMQKTLGEDAQIPEEFALKSNYPNPFNPITTINFDLAEDADVELAVFDMMGRRVATLINGRLSAGTYETQWNATNDAGNKVASGVYLYRIQAGSFHEVKQMVLMK